MASPPQSEYHVTRVASECAATGKPLQPGDQVVSALIEVVGEGDHEPELARRDFCAEVWGQDTRPTGLFAFWRSVVPAEEKPSKLALDAGSALDLFDQLEDAREPRRIAFRYLLALMLMRKRVLVLEKSEGDRLLVRRKGDDPDGPAIEVAGPTIDQEAIDELSPMVAQLVGIDS